MGQTIDEIKAMMSKLQDSLDQLEVDSAPQINVGKLNTTSRIWYEKNINRAAAYIVCGLKVIGISDQKDSDLDPNGNAYKQRQRIQAVSLCQH